MQTKPKQLLNVSFEQQRSNKSKEEELKNKYLQWKMIPKQFMKIQGTFFLKGNIFIDLSSKANSHFSSINYYKQVLNSTIIKDLGVVYKDLSTDTTQYDSIEKAIYFLKLQGNKDLKDIAEKLKGHEEKIMLNETIKRQMQQIAIANPFVRNIVAQKRLEFEELRRQRIFQISKDKYMTFSDVAFDYNDMVMKITGNGMTEALTKLLGCDLESMQSITMRKGLLNFMDEQSKWQILKTVMNLSKEKFTKNLSFKNPIGILTLDDIIINTVLDINVILCESSEAFEGFFSEEYQRFTYDRAVIFAEFEISDFHIRNINQIREKYLNGEPNNFDPIFYRPYLLSKTKLEQQEPASSPDSNNSKNKIGLGSETMEIEETTNNNTETTTLIESPQVNIDISQLPSKASVIFPTSNDIISNYIDDIPYVVQSQNFLERFYNQQLKEAAKKKKAQLNNNQLNMQQCGFKFI